MGQKERENLEKVVPRVGKLDVLLLPCKRCNGTRGQASITPPLLFCSESTFESSGQGFHISKTIAVLDTV